MKLAKYLASNQISSRAFAKKVGSSPAAVKKWRQELRIPRAATLAKINRITKGAVAPQDWY